jgi:hypothetical protein
MVSSTIWQQACDAVAELVAKGGQAKGPTQRSLQKSPKRLYEHYSFETGALHW